MNSTHKTPRNVEREHVRHIKKMKKIPRGSYPHAEGHNLRMVVISVTSYECECGKKLRTSGRMRR